MIRKFHLAKLAAERNWAAIEADEARHGPIPAELKRELLDVCNGRIEPCVRLWGSGTPRREFLYSDDLADACVFVMNLPDEQLRSVLNPTPSGPPLINIGTGEDLTIRELAETIARVVGYEGKITFDPSKPDGTPRKLLEVSRIRALGWMPSIALRDGIADAYRDFLMQTQTS
jgi:GDP-L-fucose synthase